MKRVLVLILYVILHFMILQPIRTRVFRAQITSINNNVLSPVIRVHQLESRLAYIEIRVNEKPRIVHYKIPFGSFFLGAVMGLIILRATKSFYIALISFHFIVSIWAGLTLNYLAYLHPVSLIVLDFISRYLVPLGSIGILPIAYTVVQNRIHERRIGKT